MQFKHMLVLSQKLSLMVHETQKERGASAGFIGSKGEKFIQELPKQRLLTDKRITEYHDYVKTLSPEYKDQHGTKTTNL